MAAKVSAAMEAIELYHAENVRLSRITGSYRQLSQTANLCQPNLLNRHPNRVYQADQPLEWVSGWDWQQQREALVPYEAVHCLLLADRPVEPLFWVSSNGLASGNHLVEAINHALCELIERDAVYLWQLQVSHPRAKAAYIDLETVDSLPGQALLAKLRQAGLTPYVWSLQSDVSVPVLGCAIFEQQANLSLLPLGVYQGFGCHLSREIAFIRAVTEAAQSRLTYIAGARDDIYRQEYELVRSPFHVAHWHRLFKDIPPLVDFRQLPSLATSTLSEDLTLLLRALHQAGFEQVITVDLSHPEIGVPVVRALIPGMGQRLEGSALRVTDRAKRYLRQQMIQQQLLSGEF